MFVVLEFHGPSCSAQYVRRNAADLDAFVSALAPAATPIQAGQIVGPFWVPGGGRVPAHIPLFVGKAVRAVG